MPLPTQSSFPAQTDPAGSGFFPFLFLRKQKGSLRYFLCQKLFFSTQSRHTMPLFAQLLPPDCHLLLAQLASAISSSPAEMISDGSSVFVEPNTHCTSQLCTPSFLWPGSCRNGGGMVMMMFLNILCMGNNFNFSYRSQSQLKSLRFLLIAFYFYFYLYFYSSFFFFFSTH